MQSHAIKGPHQVHGAQVCQVSGMLLVGHAKGEARLYQFSSLAQNVTAALISPASRCHFPSLIHFCLSCFPVLVRDQILAKGRLPATCTCAGVVLSRLSSPLVIRKRIFCDVTTERRQR